MNYIRKYLFIFLFVFVAALCLSFPLGVTAAVAGTLGSWIVTFVALICLSYMLTWYAEN